MTNTADYYEAMQRTQRERDDALIAFIRSEWLERGYPPTVREIGARFGLRSSSTVHSWLARLQRQGRLVSEPGKVRTLRVVE